MGKLSKALEKALPEEKSVPISVVAERNLGQQNVKQNESAAQPATSTPARNEAPPPDTANTMLWDERLILSTQPNSTVMESFKRLRNKISYPASGTPPKTILITSTVPGEGKGFVCSNLGVVLAQDMEHHALMVDCDLRKPALAKVFGVSNEMGLVDHLTSNTPIEKIIKKTGLPKLSLIPSGSTPNNPAELLNSNRMVELIEELVGRYNDRFILLDSPPYIAASETAILAKHVDAVVLVVRWGLSGRDQVKDLIETLGKEKIIGTVFNAFEENELESLLGKKGQYGYKYNQYYHYHSNE